MVEVVLDATDEAATVTIPVRRDPEPDVVQLEVTTAPDRLLYERYSCQAEWDAMGAVFLRWRDG